MKASKNYRARRAKNTSLWRAKKSRFNNARRPFVEIKSRTHSDLYVSLGGTQNGQGQDIDFVNDPKKMTYMANISGVPFISRMLPLWSYINPQQGVTNTEMLGQTLNAKYLTAKLQFNFPLTPQRNNPRYYLVHGWIKVPINNTDFTTPSLTEFTREDYLKHIDNHLRGYFDETSRNEFLDFKQVHKKDHVVLGYQRIKPNRNELQIPPAMNLQPNSQDPAVFGIPSPVNISLKWNLNNRKIRYEKGKNKDTIITEGIPFFYDNEGWLPFMLYYCPDAGVLTGNGQHGVPAIAYDNKFWFSDS